MRKLSLLWYIVALVSIVSACTRATPKPVVATPTSTPGVIAPTITATPTKIPTPLPPPKPEGVLRIGHAEWGNQRHDPYSASQTDKNQMLLVFDFLVGATLDGRDISPETGLATRWEPSPDGLIWTFWLRKGVKWDKDLGEVTAEDVKFSIDRVMKEGSEAVYAKSLAAAIREIQVVDAYTVKFYMKQKRITLAYDLAPFVGTEGAIAPRKGVEVMGDKEFALNPVGSGPYRLVKFEPGQYLKYEAREDYWGGVPRFKEIYLYIVPEVTTRVAMLKRGELDVAHVSIPQLKEVEAAGFKVFEKVGGKQLIFNVHQQWEGALADKRVRQAINLAINRKEMNDTLLEGRGQLYGVRYGWTKGHPKELPVYPYDPQKAKQLLADAGYAKGLEITLVSTPTDPLPLITQATAGYLEAIGVKTKIINTDFSGFIAGWRNLKYKDTITAYDNPNRPFIAGALRGLYHKDGLYVVSKDPQMGALVEVLEKAKDVDEMTQLEGQFLRYFYENYIEVPMLQVGEFYAVNPKVQIKTWSVGGGAPYDRGLRELLLRR